MPYETIATGLRRTFTITEGLQVGYEPDSVIHHPQTAYRAAGSWMKARAQEGQITLSGFFTEITMLYVRRTSAGRLEDGTEPALRFWGEVSLQRLSDISDEQIIVALNDLADLFGQTLGQELFTISYRDEMWVRKFIPS